jgi:uncharacterized DUF497 family protein
MDPFVWDEAKDAENRAKHGIGFDIVYEMDWSAATIREDLRFWYGGERFYVLARIDEKPFYIVIVPRDGTVRVLSARRTHEKEAKRYGI